MYDRGYNWRREPRGIAVSSLVLLAVHVMAVAFIAGIILSRTLAGAPEAVVTADPAVPADAAAAPANAVAAEGAPQVVADPAAPPPPAGP